MKFNYILKHRDLPASKRQQDLLPSPQNIFFFHVCFDVIYFAFIFWIFLILQTK